VRTPGLRFDVNCSILFTELPLLKRPGAARAAGFGAVEYWWPFAGPVPGDHEVDAFTGALADAGVQLALLNFAGGDMAAGERGLLSLPEGSAAFRANIDVCAGLAARTGCTILNALYGNRADGLSQREQDELAVENLALAACAADLYHLGTMGEDLPGVLAREAAAIAHIQVADVPGRGAPGTGELDFAALFGQLTAQGYAGWIGCEYKPSDPADSSTSFGWREPDEV
jgi:hydroxypyruvate isomerase